MQVQSFFHPLRSRVPTPATRREKMALEAKNKLLLELKMSSACVGQFRKAFFCAFADDAGVFRIERDLADHHQVKVLLRLPPENVERAVSLVLSSVESAQIGRIRPCGE